jgi:hypothetical protein
MSHHADSLRWNPSRTWIKLAGLPSWNGSGEVSEWPKEQHWKCCIGLKPNRGFESLPLRFIIPVLALSRCVCGGLAYFRDELVDSLVHIPARSVSATTFSEASEPRAKSGSPTCQLPLTKQWYLPTARLASGSIGLFAGTICAFLSSA